MAATTTPVRIAIYARVSDGRAGEAAGVARQLELCRRLCERRGWPVTAEYVDNDLSGSKPGVWRPEFDLASAPDRCGWFGRGRC